MGRSFDYDALQGTENITETILVDQSAIGRSARSNPATYLQIFAEIRDLLAATAQARKRGFAAGRFSFNVAGGRCPECQGMGEITVEMQFLADVTFSCAACGGRQRSAVDSGDLTILRKRHCGDEPLEDRDRLQGGVIEMTSELGVGTTFRILLKQAPAEETTPPTRVAA